MMSSAIRNSLKSIFTDLGSQQTFTCHEIRHPIFLMKMTIQNTDNSKRRFTELEEVEYDANRTRGVSDNAQTMSDVRCQDYPWICRCHPKGLRGTGMMRVLIAS